MELFGKNSAIADKFPLTKLSTGSLGIRGLRVARADANPLRSVTVERSGPHLVEPVSFARILLRAESDGDAVHGMNEKRVDGLGANNAKGNIDVGHTEQSGVGLKVKSSTRNVLNFEKKLRSEILLL